MEWEGIKQRKWNVKYVIVFHTGRGKGSADSISGPGSQKYEKSQINENYSTHRAKVWSSLDSAVQCHIWAPVRLHHWVVWCQEYSSLILQSKPNTMSLNPGHFVITGRWFETGDRIFQGFSCKYWLWWCWINRSNPGE